MVRSVMEAPPFLESCPCFRPSIEASLRRDADWTLSPSPHCIALRRTRVGVRFSRLSTRDEPVSIFLAGANPPTGGGMGEALERPDEPGDPFVVRLERVLAEDGLALGVVELQVDPIDAVVLALEVGLADELPAQAGPGRLGRDVLGLLGRLVVGDPVDHIPAHQLVVDTAVGAEVLVLQGQQADLWGAP